MLGHHCIGDGAQTVIVLNDWLCDTSSWEGVHAYLDRNSLRWAFCDLRGYGRSREQTGQYTLLEAAHDVLATADALGAAQFVLIGHSMSTLIALHLAQHHPDRVVRAVLITPPPARGFQSDAATVAAMQAVALGDDARRRRLLELLGGQRLGDEWAQFKLQRWRERANVEAVHGYVTMFSTHGVPEPERRVHNPVLAITGELDGEVMRAAGVKAWLAPLCDALEVQPFAECGHYPMQEVPPAFSACIQRFLRA